MTADWPGVLKVFDDQALATLASKGLLRRAQRDLEAGKARIVQCTAEFAEIAVDGQTVRMDTGGPAAARCDCPASGVCRHRLTALLLLRDLGAVETDSVAEDPDIESKAADHSKQEAEPSDTLAELLGFSLDSIERWCGKAALRAAREMLEQDWSIEIERHAASLILRLGELPEVRYLAGQGLDGMISKARGAKRKSVLAAAVLAVLRKHRPDDLAQADGFEENEPRRSKALPDEDYLNRVQSLLEDCIRQGLSFCPESLQERLFALSVTSRADDLPRLAAGLRSLSAGLERKRAGDPQVEPAELLGLCVDMSALVQALSGLAEETDSSKDDALRGLVRADYQPVGDLSLLGCGAHLWRTAAGARGVTAYFYAPEQGRWFSAGQVRGAGQDLAFDPYEAYRSTSLWGAGPLERLSRERIRLRDAAATLSGRLSLATATSGQSLSCDNPDEADELSCVYRDWHQLQSDLAREFSPGLDARRDPIPALLAPQRWAPAQFDEFRQELVWPVCDAEGRWLALRIAAGEELLIDRVERLAATSNMSLITVLAGPESTGVRLIPIAYWSHGERSGVVNLGLDRVGRQQADKPGWRQRFAERMQQLRRHDVVYVAEERLDSVQILIGQIADAVQAWSETGDAATESWSELIARADAAGLGIPADQLKAAHAADGNKRAQWLLRLLYSLRVLQGMGLRLDFLRAVRVRELPDVDR